MTHPMNGQSVIASRTYGGSTLKSCPFCGSNNIHFDRVDADSPWHIYCPDCGLATCGGWSSMEKEDLARRWNRRVNE